MWKDKTRIITLGRGEEQNRQSMSFQFINGLLHPTLIMCTDHKINMMNAAEVPTTTVYSVWGIIDIRDLYDLYIVNHYNAPNLFVL